MRIAVLALFLTACSSDTTYQRGTPARTASTFRPQEDAPHTVGQPGHQSSRPDVQRSDNRRPVQERRDGGPVLMAADGDDERAVRLMFTQDAPATPEGISPSAHRKCWNDVREMFRKEPRMLKLSHTEAKCLRNLVYAHCGSRMIEAAQRGGDFLQRHPENPMRTGLNATVGTYDYGAFEEMSSGRRNAKACGRHHEYWTPMVTVLNREMTRHGDDVLDWRNP